MVSWWSMDETSGTRADSHGSNTLTDNNTVGYTTGKVSNAAYFTAANHEYLSITDAAQSGLDTTTNYSWSMWLYCHSEVSNSILMSKYAAGGEGYSFQASKASSFIRVMTAGDVSYDISYTWPSYDTWYHIAITKETKTFKFYINNTLAGTATVTGTYNDNTSAEVRLCNMQKYTDNYLDGALDEVGVWTRAITTDEISSLYNSGNGLSYAGTASAATFIPRVSFIM